MELIVMVLAAFPLGYLIRSRTAALVTYIAIHSFMFSFQNTSLLMEWLGGDHSAFPKGATSPPWSYLLVNLAIYAAGLGLVALGGKVRAKAGAKRTRNTVDIAG
ncbi:hypothetical protein ACF09J_32030 [Streptomyces sp. NPDC014889]|uniref:hypothetical protein n=1 Tax=Streptomyces sp. NPDC014889 TaxID=3364928 RepID=UPI0036F5119A